MSKLSLDRDKVDLAKRLAEQIVNPVQHFIDRHTTVSIERCVLRLMGVQGMAEARPKGEAAQGRFPLVNSLIDLLDLDKLEQGAGYWFGLAALQHPKLDPSQLARKIVDGKIDLDKLDKRPISEIDKACQKFLKPQLEILRKNREHKAKRPPWANPGQPLRYVIVATGNIHEDILQAEAAAEMGADIIAVIRSTAQSLLDYVPEGATTEGFGGTYATQENFRMMRQALNDVEKRLKRRIGLTNYSSGLCMPEIAVLGALEGVDYLLNDAMYGILFRDINMKRNFVDQFFSRRICALSGITIQTGEDNYLTTAESYKYWYQVLASHFINHAFARRAGIGDASLALGHAFEMDPNIEDSILYEWAQAQLVRELFPRAPLKFMPPTKHKTGDIFFSYLYDGMFNLAGALTGQTIMLLGMHTEAIHNPFVQDRYLSLKNANYVFRAAKGAKDEIFFQPHGKVARRARQVMDDAMRFLKKVRMRGLFRAIEEGAFANVRRDQEGGKGMDGVLHKVQDYYTPLQHYLSPRALQESVERDRTSRRPVRRRPTIAPKRGLKSSRSEEKVGRERKRGPISRRSEEKVGRERKRGPVREKRPPRPQELKAKNQERPKSPPKKLPKKVSKGPSEKDSPARSGGHWEKSEVELQREFHREMLQRREVAKKSPLPQREERKDFAPLPRRSLEKDPEETQPLPEVLPKDKVQEEVKEFQSLPRRTLKSEKEDEKKNTTGSDPEETQPLPETKPVSPGESDKDYHPLPRRPLKG